MDSPVVIGLEIHAELNTEMKLFCSCPRTGSDEPNTRTCPTCLGHPGSRPVLNEQALKSALKACLALGCTLDDELVFSRKSYFYPDMSKNYQITQYERPLGKSGALKLRSGETIGITRIHLEEDPASVVYPQDMLTSDHALLDYNRAGNPLIEIVTEPDITSPAQARAFMRELSTVLNYLGVRDETCTLKADANLSIEETGYERVEIKNIGGFKDIEKALSYEVTRHKQAHNRGESVSRETRGYSDVRGATVSLRIKETEADYGYIAEPDLVTTDITSQLVTEAKDAIPELAADKAKRYAAELGVEESTADVLAASKDVAEFYEELAAVVDPVLAANWTRREVLRVLNYNDLTLDEAAFSAQDVAELLSLLETDTVSERVAQKLMEDLATEQFSPKKRVREEGLEQVSGEDELQGIVKRVIDENPDAVQDYAAGEEKAFHYLVGQVMRKTRGAADPDTVNELLTTILTD